MGKTPATIKRREREAAADMARELAGLQAMTTPQLATKWEAVTGEKPRSHNGPNLRRRLAWRIQELALGGLSDAAVAKIEELAPLAEALWRKGATTAHRLRRGADPVVVGQQRDPRLPAPGTVIKRTHGGTEHEVTVLADGFEYRGERYRSLSKIAREITKTAWNGIVFFGLASRKGSAAKQVAA